MFYRGYSEVGEYCGRFFGRSPMFMHSPWGILFGILGIILVVVLTVVIVKAASKNKRVESDENIKLLESKYAAGEIDEKEYLRKRKILKK